MSKSSIEWLENQLDVVVDWPGNSPCRSPTELLWAVLNREVDETRDDVRQTLVVA
jgi:hypothetical protein